MQPILQQTYSFQSNTTPLHRIAGYHNWRYVLAPGNQQPKDPCRHCDQQRRARACVCVRERERERERINVNSKKLSTALYGMETIMKGPTKNNKFRHEAIYQASETKLKAKQKTALKNGSVSRKGSIPRPNSHMHHHFSPKRSFSFCFFLATVSCRSFHVLLRSFIGRPATYLPFISFIAAR